MLNENELVQKHLGLVVNIANTFSPRDSSELDDFIQEGSIALLKAIRKHDAKRGTLPTLAWKYVTRALIQYSQKLARRVEYNILYDGFIDNREIERLSDSIPSTLSQLELSAITLKSQGYTFREIGLQFGHTKGWSRHIFYSAIEKIKLANL